MSVLTSVSGFAAFGVLVRSYALGLQKRSLSSGKHIWHSQSLGEFSIVSHGALTLALLYRSYRICYCSFRFRWCWILCLQLARTTKRSNGWQEGPFAQEPCAR